jgi:uncharacterized protein YlxW (UPF0749 family)
MIPEFKYKSTFEFPIKTVYASAQGGFLSTASLEEIKALAPDELHIKENFDLLYTVFNSAVVNRVNKNHDGIDAATATKIYKNFIHKPMNIEHNRKMIVGHIINVGFSEYKTNKVYNLEEAQNSKNPYYLNLSAVVYKVADPELCNILIEASDETSPNYKAVCTSWELGFNEYHILLGHKDIAEGKLVTDPQEIQAFSKYLKAYGGSGQLEDGTPVYRIIVGDVLPLGCGFTTSPAAEVEGVLVVNNDKVPENKERHDEDDASNSASNIINQIHEVGEQLAASVEDLTKAINDTQIIQNSIENQNISSQQKNNTVNIHSIMRLEDITDDLLKETSAASVRDFLSNEIEKITKEYGEKLDAANTEVSSHSAKATELAEQLSNLTQQLTQIQAELSSEKEARANQQAEADYKERVTDLNEKYNLNDKDREVIAKRIRGLSAEQYASWFEEFSTFAAEKLKTNKPKTEEAVASVEDILDNAAGGNVSVPNVQNLANDLKSKWAKNFKLEDIVVTDK